MGVPNVVVLPISEWRYCRRRSQGSPSIHRTVSGTSCTIHDYSVGGVGLCLGHRHWHSEEYTLEQPRGATSKSTPSNVQLQRPNESAADEAPGEVQTPIP